MVSSDLVAGFKSNGHEYHRVSFLLRTANVSQGGIAMGTRLSLSAVAPQHEKPPTSVEGTGMRVPAIATSKPKVQYGGGSLPPR